MRPRLPRKSKAVSAALWCPLPLDTTTSIISSTTYLVLRNSSGSLAIFAAIRREVRLSAGGLRCRDHPCLARDFLASWWADSAREGPGLGFLSALTVWAVYFVDGLGGPRRTYDSGRLPGPPLRCPPHECQRYVLEKRWLQFWCLGH